MCLGNSPLVMTLWDTTVVDAIWPTMPFGKLVPWSIRALTFSMTPGGTYVRDAEGELTGHVIGAPAFGRLVALLPRPDVARLVAAIGAASRRLLAVGITGVIEPGLTAEQIAAFRRAREEGALGVRAVLMPGLEPGVTTE